jgi:uncharacterized protein (DUF1697 family)
MTRYVAFLGGINVGGHRVTMDTLRAEFEAIRLTGVSTFIASGNVLFEASGKAAPLESKIEAHLAERLGYPVPTFVRTATVVVGIAGREPFGAIADGDTHLVAFLRKAPTAAAKKATEALGNDQDRLAVHGRELHWLVHGGFSDTRIKTSVLAKALGQPWTTRNTKSLRKLAERLRMAPPR